MGCNIRKRIRKHLCQYKKTYIKVKFLQEYSEIIHNLRCASRTRRDDIKPETKLEGVGKMDLINMGEHKRKKESFFGKITFFGEKNFVFENRTQNRNH